MKKLLLIPFLVFTASAQRIGGGGSGGGLQTANFASPPAHVAACSSVPQAPTCTYLFSGAASPGVCNGTGSSYAICVDNGTTFVAASASSSGGTGNAASKVTVAFSATPAYNCGSATAGTGTSFSVGTLTGNITSSTETNCTTGQIMSFTFTENGVGGFTVVMPTGFDACPVNTAIGASTTCQYWLDSAGAHLIGTSNSVQSVGGQTGAVTGQGNGTKVQMASGTTATGDAIKYDASGNAIDAGAPAVLNTTTVNGHALSSNVTVSASDVGLGSVTNDTQTKAAVVPNTAPSAGQVLAGNAGGTAYAPVTVSGDSTMTSAGVMTNTKLNGGAFSGTNGNVVTFGASNTPADSGFLASTLARAGAAFTAGAFKYDFSAATHALPAPVGVAASKPATCTVGEMYFATDATAGQNWYFCTATNTWTQQLNSGGGGGGSNAVFTSVASSATPTFTVTASSTPQIFKMTLTGNVTSSTLTATSATAGQQIGLQLLQDATGGRTFVYPTNFLGGCTISGAANVLTTIIGIWDGTNVTNPTCTTNDSWKGISAAAVAFSNTPACTPSLYGSQTWVSDSATTVLGAVITGSGSNAVLGFCAAAGWLVGAGATSAPPSGTAGGDLSGTYPNPGVAKVNAVTYPASPSTNTVPVVTAPNTITYQQVPNAALANTATTVNGATCTLGSACAPYGGATVYTSAHTVGAADIGKLIVMNCSAACALTFKAAPAATDWWGVMSIGSTLATVSLNSLNWNGLTAVPVLNSFRDLRVSSDGSNYFGPAPLVAGTNVTFTPASNGMTVAATNTGATAFSALTGSTNSMAAMVVGTGASLATSGTGTINANQVNGGTVPVSAHVLGSNSSSQTVAATAHDIVTPYACADSSGSGSAQNCTTSPSFTPAANDCVWYTTTTANTGTGLTTNINSLGAKSIAIPGASGWTTTLTANVIPSGKPLLACYDGTNWDVQQTGTAASGGGSGPTIDGISCPAMTATTFCVVDDFIPNAQSTYGGMASLGWLHSPSLGGANDWAVAGSSNAPNLAGHPGVIYAATGGTINKSMWAEATGGGSQIASADKWGGITILQIFDSGTQTTDLNMTGRFGFATGSNQPGGGTTTTWKPQTGCFLEALNGATNVDWFLWCGTSGTYDTAVDTGVSATAGWVALEVYRVDANTVGAKVASTLSGLTSASVFCITTAASAPGACTGASPTLNATHMPSAQYLNLFWEVDNTAATSKTMAIDLGAIYDLSLSR